MYSLLINYLVFSGKNSGKKSGRTVYADGQTRGPESVSGMVTE